MPTMRKVKDAANPTRRMRGQDMEEYSSVNGASAESEWAPAWSPVGRAVELPDLVVQGADQGWRADSACLESELDFVPEILSKSKAEELKAVCNACLVKDECLDFATANQIIWGVYGGKTPKERGK